jgi:hypothetical protein
MPEMDITGKLLLITVIGALIGAIVLYHLRVDRRRETRPTADTAAPGTPEKSQPGADTARSAKEKNSES